MSAFYYKNMLIIQYGTDNIYIRNFLFHHYKLWWDSDDPFQYRNSHDMIVIFHSLTCKGIMSYYDPRIYNLQREFYPNGTAIGHMKILANMGKLKVAECTLKGISNIKYNLPTFREYLVKTKCTTLYWTPKALESIEAMVLYYRLLSDEKTLSYRFALDDKLPLEYDCLTNSLTNSLTNIKICNILLKNSYRIQNVTKRLNDTNRIIARPKQRVG